jgi:hypothetical protein
VLQVTLSERFVWDSSRAEQPQPSTAVLPVLGMAPSPSFRKLFVVTQAGTLHCSVLDVDPDAPAAVSKPGSEIDLDKVSAHPVALGGVHPPPCFRAMRMPLPFDIAGGLTLFWHRAGGSRVRFSSVSDHRTGSAASRDAFQHFVCHRWR